LTKDFGVGGSEKESGVGFQWVVFALLLELGVLVPGHIFWKGPLALEAKPVWVSLLSLAL
jgi:hypothetical protein